LGSINIPKDWGIEEYLDVATITQYDISLKERQKETGEEKPDMTRTMESIRTKARDNSRLPHQWNTAENAGFTAPGVKPWMRVNDDYRTFNAKVQMADSDSVLNFWKQALKVRKEHLVLVRTSFSSSIIQLQKLQFI
jgi:oligo-1,6-glucosidase